MNREPIEAVIFDCDGTLVDSESLSISVLVDFVSELGLQLDFHESLQQFSGNDLSFVLGHIERQLGRDLPPSFMGQFRRRQMRILRQQVRAVDGAEDLLASMNLPFCIASNAPPQKIEVCLKTAGLDHFFRAGFIQSAYDIGVWKPAPDLFLKSAQLLRAPPERCAVVEDSIYGIDAGVSAGMQVYALDPHGRFSSDSRITTVPSLFHLKPLLLQ